MSNERYGAERKKYSRPQKTIIAETQINTSLINPKQYSVEIDSQSTSPIRNLEILNASLRGTLTNYLVLERQDPAKVRRFIDCQMNKYGDILYGLPTGYAKEVYPLAFSFIQLVNELLTKLPHEKLKPSDKTFGDAIEIILNNLYDNLYADYFRSSAPHDLESTLSLLKTLKEHQLISQTGLSGACARVIKFAVARYCDKVPVEDLNFLLATISSSRNLHNIEEALADVRKLIEHKKFDHPEGLNLSCIDLYFRNCLGSSESKSKSPTATINLEILFRAINSLSHICRDLKRIGSYRSDIHMLTLETISEIVATHKEFKPPLIVGIGLSLGHIIQAQGQITSEKFKAQIKESLNKINNLTSAQELQLKGIANAVYGALLAQVLDSTATNKLIIFFKAALKKTFQDPKSYLDEYHSYVSQVAQYLRFCKEKISPEMHFLIRKKCPLVDESSLEYRLIEYAKTQDWFENLKITYQYQSDIFFTDGRIDVLDENVFYLVEVDGYQYHNPIKDARRDEHLLACYKEQGIETLGIIRILVEKETTIKTAVENWRKQHKERLEAFQKAHMTCARAQCFEQGNGVPKNPKKALVIYLSIAKAESAESSLALFHLGRYYEKGLSVKINHEQAINFYILAAAQGLLAAQKKLATYYEQGICVKQNFNRAFYFYSLAVKQQDPESMLNLAFYHFGGLAVKRDLRQGEKLLTNALKCKNQAVREQFVDKVREFLTDIEDEITEDNDKKATHSFYIKDSSNDLVARLERLKEMLSSQGSKSNRQVLATLVDIFHRGLKSSQKIQVANLIKVGQVARWSDAPDKESQSKEKIIIKSQQERQPLVDISNLPHTVKTSQLT